MILLRQTSKKAASVKIRSCRIQKWEDRLQQGLNGTRRTISREAIEVGAFSWSRVQRLYDGDSVAHWQRCESEGLQCPQEVFTQLFHEQSTNEDFAVIVRSIDWGRVRWELQEISGIAMRHLRVGRGFQHALDEARNQATSFGILDEPTLPLSQ